MRNKLLILILGFSFLFAGCFEQGGTNDGLAPNPPGVQPPPIEQPDVLGNWTNVSESNETLDSNETINGTLDVNGTNVGIGENKTENNDSLVVEPEVENMHMLFLDVGFGDSTLIKAGKRVILVDAGADGQTVSTRLAELNITDIDLLVISSWDDEKIGGVRIILRDFKVGEVWTSQEVPANFIFDSIKDYIDKHEVLLTHPKIGDKYHYGDIEIDVYNPQKEEYLNYADANSIVMRVNFGDFCAFLPSDLEQVMEQPVVNALDDKTCAVYKWRNNGEGRPNPSILFDKVSPSDTIISVGPNEFGYPSSTTIQRLGIARNGIYRTDIDGDIYVNAKKDGTYIIEPENDLRNLSVSWN